jgi:glutamate carboxypeptidase
MSELTEYFQQKEEPMVSQLRQLINIESPSNDKGAVNHMADRIQELLLECDAEIQRFPGKDTGDMVLGAWNESPGDPGIGLLCHMDTVWPVGTLAERPVRVEDGKLFGPGAYDMKAGIVISLTAIKGLQDLGRLPNMPIRMLCTADEEIGSHASREEIEALAHLSRLILVLEPALPGGIVKTARKGVGGYTIQAEGRAAHAGGDHQKGRNAIEEMAHQILKLQKLTNYELGTTVNVGEIKGGSASNVVPADCTIEVDYRITRVEEVKRLEDAVCALKPVLDGTKLHIEGGLNRPPMVRDERMVATFEKARQIAAGHGIALQEGSTGGASDANFTSSIAPSLDGFGADGDGAHAVYEHVLITSLPQRAALAAALISEW